MIRFFTTGYLFIFVCSCAIAQTSEPIPFDQPRSQVNTASMDVFENSEEVIDGVVIIDTDELSLLISPNPAQYWINIDLKSYPKAKSYIIADSKGEILRETKLPGSQIDVSAFNNGTYFLLLLNGLSIPIATGQFIILK